MNVLIACEESQTVCKAFRELGHRAFSCDLQESSGGHPEWHINGNCIPLIDGNCEFFTEDGVIHRQYGQWDLLIAHPPCTYMSKAGARWMYLKAGELNQERYRQAIDAKDFFMKFLNAKCKYIAVENPVPLKIIELPKPTCYVQPYEFGEPFSKRRYYGSKTCLRLCRLKFYQSTGLTCRQTLEGRKEVRSIVVVSLRMQKSPQKHSRVSQMQWLNNGVNIF